MHGPISTPNRFMKSWSHCLKSKSFQGGLEEVRRGAVYTTAVSIHEKKSTFAAAFFKRGR